MVREEEASEAEGEDGDDQHSIHSESDEAPQAKRARTNREKEAKTRQLLLVDSDTDRSDGEEDGERRTGEMELEEFLRESSKAPSGPLAWWKENASRYPKLARAAKRLLAIPATSTPSERIFSKAGFIVNKHRSSLLPKNVDTLVFLAHNEPRVQISE